MRFFEAVRHVQPSDVTHDLIRSSVKIAQNMTNYPLKPSCSKQNSCKMNTSDIECC